MNELTIFDNIMLIVLVSPIFAWVGYTIYRSINICKKGISKLREIEYREKKITKLDLFIEEYGVKLMDEFFNKEKEIQLLKDRIKHSQPKKLPIFFNSIGEVFCEGDYKVYWYNYRPLEINSACFNKIRSDSYESSNKTTEIFLSKESLKEFIMNILQANDDKKTISNIKQCPVLCKIDLSNWNITGVADSSTDF